MQCPECRARIPDKTHVCPSCGAQIPGHPARSKSDAKPSWSEPTQLVRVPCPHCGKNLLPGQERCPHCGKPIPLDHLMKMPVFEDLGDLDALADLGIAVDLKAPTEDLSESKTRVAPTSESVEPETDPDATREFEPPPIESPEEISPPPEPPAEAPAPTPPASSAMADSPTLAIHPGGTLPPPAKPAAPLPWSLFLWGGAFLVSAGIAFLVLRPILANRSTSPPRPAAYREASAASTPGPPPEAASDRQTRLRLWIEREKRWTEELHNSYGILNLTTPYPARVYIDGVRAGVAPIRNFYLTRGRHRIEIRIPDTEPVPPRERSQVRTVDIQPGETVHLELVVNRYGRLYVNSLPWGTVFIDGRRAGTTPYIHTRVPVGTHEVTIRTVDGRVFRKTVVVEENQIVRVGHNFSEG